MRLDKDMEGYGEINTIASTAHGIDYTYDETRCGISLTTDVDSSVAHVLTGSGTYWPLPPTFGRLLKRVEVRGKK